MRDTQVISAMAAAGMAAGWLDHPRLRRLQAARGLVTQLGRYGLVSIAALGCDVAVFLLLTGSHVRPALAGAAGYGVGLVLHFLLSTLCVFDTTVTVKSLPRLFGEFALSGAIGLVLTACVIGILATGLGVAPVLAKVAAVVASFFVVFVLRRSVVFAARPGIQPA